jgi:hypothetical protein
MCKNGVECKIDIPYMLPRCSGYMRTKPLHNMIDWVITCEPLHRHSSCRIERSCGGNLAESKKPNKTTRIREGSYLQTTHACAEWHYWPREVLSRSRRDHRRRTLRLKSRSRRAPSVSVSTSRISRRGERSSVALPRGWLFRSLL